MMGVWALIMGWWNARRRQIDIDILLPICLQGANDLDHAMAAFAMHAFNDPAWRALGQRELERRLDAMYFEMHNDLTGA